MKRALVGATLCMLALCQPSHAKYREFYATSCGKWTSDRKAGGDRAAQAEARVHAWLSEKHSIGSAGGAMDVEDVQSLWTDIDNYCAAHPYSDVGLAPGM
jgi:hypothetical protein